MIPMNNNFVKMFLHYWHDLWVDILWVNYGGPVVHNTMTFPQLNKLSTTQRKHAATQQNYNSEINTTKVA